MRPIALWKCTAFAASLSAAGLLAGTALGQGQPPPGWTPPPPAQPAPWPDAQRPAAPGQAAPARQSPRPQAQRPARKPAPVANDPEPNPDAPARKPAARSAAKPAGARIPGDIVRCDGPFARDTTHEKIVEAFGAKNVTFTQVDAAEGTKADATVIFPNDPAKRIEVLWHDEAARQKPASIVLGAKSTRRLDKGVRIGASLEEVQRMNGKPFKLMGFDWTYGGTVSDWNGGVLANISGGCRLGVRFKADGMTPWTVRSKVLGESEFESTDPNMRGSKPKVFDLFLSYPAE